MDILILAGSWQWTILEMFGPKTSDQRKQDRRHLFVKPPKNNALDEAP